VFSQLIIIYHINIIITAIEFSLGDSSPYTKGKGKATHYTPGQALRVPGD
jgi:hypothetical protein